MATAKRGKKKPANSKPTTEREVVHKSVLAKVYDTTPITTKLAKKLLGWQEESSKDKFGSNFLFKDVHGHKVRCTNNITNRPLYRNILETLKQEHLRKRWQLNGETIIIGKTGLILNGQHTLISLVLAAQEWEQNKGIWDWENEPTMQKVVILGISEDDATANTMDTCKPRSLSDVIYRSKFFANLSTRERRIASRTADYSVRLLWSRTGAIMDAYSPRRTHAEALDFIARHPRLLECVSHIGEENGTDNKLGKFISPGYASGLMYLMGSSSTDPTVYHRADTPKEDMLKWDNWDKASDFFVMLAGGAKEVAEVKASIAMLINDGQDSVIARCAILSKGWQQHVANKLITAKKLRLEYLKDPNSGKSKLIEIPTVGGIDLGNPKEADVPIRQQPVPTEILQQKEQTRDDNETKKREVVKRSPRRKKGKGKAKPTIAPGKLVWVVEADGEHWQGKVVEILGKNARLTVGQYFQGAGNTRTAPLATLQFNQPT